MWRVLILSVGLAVVTGCGKKEDGVTVNGTITYKGNAVNGAGLLLYPQSGTAITLPVTQQGTFVAGNVPEGEYLVVVQPSTGSSNTSTKGMDAAKAAEAKSKLEAMKSQPTITIPQKYTNKKTTDLKLTITKGIQTIDLVLKD